MNLLSHAPETKSAGGGDVAAAFEDFARTFDAFRSANDERLAEIEKIAETLLANPVIEDFTVRVEDAS